VNENEKPPPGPVGPPPGGLKGIFNVSVPSWTSWRALGDVGERLIGGFGFRGLEVYLGCSGWPVGRVYSRTVRTGLGGRRRIE